MATYILMNKNTPIMSFEYDTEIHAAYKINEYFDLKYAPPAILDMKGNVTKKSLNDWWRGRAIPASRNHIQALLDSLSIESTLELAEKTSVYLFQIDIGLMIRKILKSGLISTFLIMTSVMI